MKFSLRKKDDIEQSLDITIKAEEIETKVSSKLNSVQKSAKIKGFRKGKAPLDLVTKIYEPEIRQDVINEVVVRKFYDQVEEKGLKLVGKPNLTPERVEKNKDLKFKANFETYPEIKINDLNRLTYTKITSSVTDGVLNEAIENIQKKMCSWEPSKEVSSLGDKVKINFSGTIDGEKFDGGTAEDFFVEIGSKSMIQGFEEAIIGLKEHDKKAIDLKFPKEYVKPELASKDVTFHVEVKEVQKPILPKLNIEFFKNTGIDVKSIKEFREEVKSKLEEDLRNLLKNKSKASILDSLRKEHEFKVPLTMIESEVNNLRSDTARRMGMDPKKIKDELLPRETFEEEALNRVTTGILLNKIIEDKQVKPDSKRVRDIIEERAAMYKEPQQVVNWFYSNEEQLKSIESIVLEEQVIDLLLTEASVVEEELTYEDCVSGS